MSLASILDKHHVYKQCLITLILLSLNNNKKYKSLNILISFSK